MAKLRWGLLGCGDIASKRVADAIRCDPESELVAACRRDKEKLDAFARQFDVAFSTTSDEELIGRDDLDVIYVATPVYEHCRQTIAAAAAGKHVLVEKPMALDVPQCRQMIDACDSAGVVLGVAYYRRFYPVVLRVRDLVASGAIGRPLSILATTGNDNRFPADDWRVVKELGGGGPLMDIGSHRIDLFLQILGDVTRVKALCAQSPNYEAEDVASLLMEFSGGCHAVLQCYFGMVNTPDRLEVIGTEGRLTTEDLNRGDLSIHTSDGTRQESLPPHENLHAPLVTDFREAIQAGRVPAVTGQIGMATNQIIADAYHEGNTNA